MSEQLKFQEESLHEIIEDYYKEWNFTNLGKILSRLADLEEREGGSYHIEVWRGHTLNRRAEWYDAFQSLQRAFERYPDRIELCYEAALNGIDAGCYDEAGKLLECLGSQLDLMSDRHLRGIWRGAGVVGNINLAKAAFELALGKGSSLALPSVGRRIEEAIKTQSRELAPIISVGENCQPWMLPNRWGLRRRDDISRQSSMFNLGQSNCQGVAKILEDLGAGMVLLRNLSINPNDGHAPFPENNLYEYGFNHERGGAWIEDDFSLLRARYEKRRASFGEFLQGPKRVFLFYSDRDGDISSVVEALYKINRDENFKIVAIDLFAGNRSVDLAHYPEVSYAKLSFPKESYIWWKPDHHDSDLGVYFERTIRDVVLEAATI